MGWQPRPSPRPESWRGWSADDWGKSGKPEDANAWKEKADWAGEISETAHFRLNFHTSRTQRQSKVSPENSIKNLLELLSTKKMMKRSLQKGDSRQTDNAPDWRTSSARSQEPGAPGAVAGETTRNTEHCCG